MQSIHADSAHPIPRDKTAINMYRIPPIGTSASHTGIRSARRHGFLSKGRNARHDRSRQGKRTGKGQWRNRTRAQALEHSVSVEIGCSCCCCLHGKRTKGACRWAMTLLLVGRGGWLGIGWCKLRSNFCFRGKESGLAAWFRGLGARAIRVEAEEGLVVTEVKKGSGRTTTTATT